MRRALVFGLFVLHVAACGDDDAVECQSSSECNLHPEGVCLEAPTGNTWCAYAGAFAAGCPSDLRWSESAGDGLANMCVEGPDGGMMPDAATDAGADAGEPDASGPRLSVVRGGTGGGTVSSLPSGIDCGPTCEATFMPGTVVVLSNTPDPGNTFSGWSGACSGMGACMVTMDSDKQVIASFDAPPGEKLWLRQFGGTGADDTYEARTDSAGDIIIAGTFTGTVDFGGGMMETSAGSTDIFVAKLARTTGGTLWVQTFGGTGEEWLEVGLNVDASDNIVVAGRFSSATASVDGMTATAIGGGDVYVFKLSGTDGSPQWVQEFGGTGLDHARDLATDTAENVYVTGGFNSPTMAVGATTLTTAGAGDIFLFKLAGSNGNPIWAKDFGAASEDIGTVVATTSTDDVVVGGTFRNTVDFEGSMQLVSAGNDDIFLATYDASGTEVWSTRFGGTGQDTPEAIEVSAGDAITLGGRFQSPTITFGGDTFMPTGTNALFLARISVAGNHQWSESWESSGFETAKGLGIHPLGDVYIAGQFSGTFNLGGGALISAGGGTSFDIFLARFNGADISHEYSRKYGGADIENAGSVAISTDRAVICGSFSGIAEFQDEVLTSAGGFDGYCLAVAP